MPSPSRTNLPFESVPDDNYHKDLMGFANEAIQQGDAYLKAQTGYEKIQKSIDAIMSVEDAVRSSSLSSTQANHVGKTAMDLASGLTDTKPFWEFRTPPGSSFEKTGENLGKVSEYWYLQRR